MSCRKDEMIEEFRMKKEFKEELMKIIGFGMEPERAELKVQEILEIFNKYKKIL